MSEQITIGEFLRQLDKIENSRPETSGYNVYFNFAGCYPTTIKSWRGVYAYPAIGYAHGGKPPKLSDFIATVRSSIYTIIQGYKGGSYRIQYDSPMFVANWGHTDRETGVTGVTADDCYVVINTATGCYS